MLLDIMLNIGGLGVSILGKDKVLKFLEGCWASW